MSHISMYSLQCFRLASSLHRERCLTQLFARQQVAQTDSESTASSAATQAVIRALSDSSNKDFPVFRTPSKQDSSATLATVLIDAHFREMVIHFGCPLKEEISCQTFRL